MRRDGGGRVAILTPRNTGGQCNGRQETYFLTILHCHVNELSRRGTPLYSRHLFALNQRDKYEKQPVVVPVTRGSQLIIDTRQEFIHDI